MTHGVIATKPKLGGDADDNGAHDDTVDAGGHPSGVLSVSVSAMVIK